MEIRLAIESDCESILGLIQELATFEKEPLAVKNTVEQLRKDGFGKNPLFHAYLAELDGKAIGFSLFFFSYSTWVGKCLYLEDLYVSRDHRYQVPNSNC